MKLFTPRNAEITMRLLRNATLKDVADMYDMSAVNARRILRRSIRLWALSDKTRHAVSQDSRSKQRFIYTQDYFDIRIARQFADSIIEFAISNTIEDGAPTPNLRLDVQMSDDSIAANRNNKATVIRYQEAEIIRLRMALEIESKKTRALADVVIKTNVVTARLLNEQAVRLLDAIQPVSAT